MQKNLVALFAAGIIALRNEVYQSASPGFLGLILALILAHASGSRLERVLEYAHELEFIADGEHTAEKCGVANCCQCGEQTTKRSFFSSSLGILAETGRIITDVSIFLSRQLILYHPQEFANSKYLEKRRLFVKSMGWVSIVWTAVLSS